MYAMPVESVDEHTFTIVTPGTCRGTHFDTWKAEVTGTTRYIQYLTYSQAANKDFYKNSQDYREACGFCNYFTDYDLGQFR